MKRPHMQLGISPLESLFLASTADLNSLKRLKNELQFRHVPRAVALLERVEKAMACLGDPADVTRSSPSSTVQATIFTAPVAVSVPAIAVSPAGPMSAVAMSSPSDEQCSGRDVAVPWLLTLPQVAVQPPPALLQLSLALPLHIPLYEPLPATPTALERLANVAAASLSVEEAYKVLKATPASTWEAIEQSRRQVVQQSHPDVLALLREEARAVLVEQAQHANSAYAVLRLTRVA